MRKVVATPDFAAAVQKFGIHITNLGSREMTKLLDEETVRWARIFGYAGIVPD